MRMALMPVAMRISTSVKPRWLRERRPSPRPRLVCDRVVIVIQAVLRVEGGVFHAGGASVDGDPGGGEDDFFHPALAGDIADGARKREPVEHPLGRRAV